MSKIRTFGIILSAVAFAFSLQSCNSKQAKQTVKDSKSSCCDTQSAEQVASCCETKTKEVDACCSSKATTADVQAYYFHATRRCATCEAVEKVTAETLKAKYDGKVSFTSINREEEKDNPLLIKFKVKGQTLLLVKGDEIVNLTNEAFLNARSHPEKLQAKLVSTVETLLN